MSESDDRAWKAEDMLQGVVGSKRIDSESTRDRIDQYFDRIDTPAGESPTISVLPTAGLPASGGGALADDAQATSPLPSQPPVAVPNHTLIRCLGAGGFGQVWLAKHALTEHYRACKLIPADKAIELDGLKRLKQRVPGHPSLFPIEEVGSAEDWLYCLMPLADTASTDHAMLDDSGYEPLTLGVHLERHGRRPTDEVATIGLEISGAVRVLHEHGITHGDIKPANIMRLNGHWTLADYGLARDLSAPSGQGHTPGYSPPEGPGTRSADLYALGVVLMELLTSWPARMLADFRKTPIEQFKLDPDGPRLVEVILRATSNDTDERFGSVDELIEALQTLVSDSEQRIASHPARGRRRMWQGIAVAASVVLALGAWLFLPGLLDGDTAPPTTAKSPIAIESFEVRHYRYNAATDTTVAIGPINADNPAVREGDDVTLHARLSQEGYVFLLSLDADGRVRPRIPASPTVAPTSTNGIDYPSLPTGTLDDIMYNLSRGPGTHGFMLLTSDEPLPPWSDWIALHGEPTWSRESLPPNGIILFDGLETTYSSATRDPMPRRGQLMLDPIDWAKTQKDLTTAFIAFPVLPPEED